MNGAGGADPKLAELSQLLSEVRERVRERHAQSAPGHINLPDLLPILHARDAAYGKIAAIGTVNPRKGGLVNSIVQSIKKLVSRALDWHVREQVEFNRASVAGTEAILAALEENNRILKELASRIAAVNGVIESFGRDSLDPAVREFNDIRAHWIGWRSEWERKLGQNEMQFMRGLADIQNAFNHRATLMESNFRDMVKSQHTDYLGALDRTNQEIQRRLWADLDKARHDLRIEFLNLIHEEIRVLRQKAWMFAPPPGASVAGSTVSGGTPESVNFDFDQWRFADKFRGPEDYVRTQHEYYLPHFRECQSVIDLGCGRGEFLSLLQQHNIRAKGIELNPELVSYCRHKGLDAEQADVFQYLEQLKPGSVDGVFCAQVVEHLPPPRVLELIRLAASRLARGGVLAIETPNPECLAIFASHFYLDPTHTRPIPPALLQFYFEEAGFGMVEVRRFAPAIDSMPELATLPAPFRDKFFSSLDYAIVARNSA